MLGTQDVLLLHDVIDLLVESEQVRLIVNLQALPRSERLAQIVHLELLLLRRLNIVHVVLLLLLKTYTRGRLQLR